MKIQAAAAGLLFLAAACSPGEQSSSDGALSGSGGVQLDAGGSGAGGGAGLAGNSGSGGMTGSGGLVGSGGGAGSGGRSGSGGAGSGGAGSGGVVGSGGSTGSGGKTGSGGAGSGGAAGCGAPGGATYTTTTTHLDIGVHDPSMIWNGSRWFLFATGGLLNVRSSANIQQWSNAGNVLAATPAWVVNALGKDPGGFWAPDVSFFNCKYHVYYAGSSFGTNNSVIGLATTPALSSSGTVWTDQGLVVQSKSSDNYNAIDPNVAFDEAGNPWLSFGSFWSGIKLRKLDPSTGKPSTTDTTLYSIASRNGGAIEAPSIISRNGYYYLLVSYDKCCDGVNSTYRTMVGRATKITGPYTNKAGASMMQGNAEQLLVSSGRYIGPGGGTAFRNGSNYLYVFHYYDGQNNGASKLQIRPINFDASDWPTLGDPLFP